MKFTKDTALIICRCILLFAGAILVLVCTLDATSVSVIIAVCARKLLGLNHHIAKHDIVVGNVILLGPSFFLLARFCDFMGDEERSQRQRRGVGVAYGMTSLALLCATLELSPV